MTLTTAQHKERLTGLGASDAPVAMGLSKWKTPLALYLEKTQETEPENLDDVELLYWGSKLEPMIAEAWSERHGIKVQRVNQTLRHPEHDFMLCHLDRRQVGRQRILECKNTNQFYAAREFGDEGTDEVPDLCLVQMYHQIEIVRAKWGWSGADLAALIGGNKLKSYSFEYDEELAAMIIQRLAAFWQGVQDRIPPAPQTIGDLDMLYAQDNGEIKDVADAEIVHRWELLHEIKTKMKGYEKMIKELELALKLAIAESAGIKLNEKLLTSPDCPGIAYAGKILATYKTETRKAFTVPESKFRVLRLAKP